MIKANYSAFKTSFYIIGLILTFISILKDGLLSSHTPPIGFVIPVLVLILGLLWGLVDWVILLFLPNAVINHTQHYYGLALNLLIVFLILVYTL